MNQMRSAPSKTDVGSPFVLGSWFCFVGVVWAPPTFFTFAALFCFWFAGLFSVIVGESAGRPDASLRVDCAGRCQAEWQEQFSDPVPPYCRANDWKTSLCMLVLVVVSRSCGAVSIGFPKVGGFWLSRSNDQYYC